MIRPTRNYMSAMLASNQTSRSHMMNRLQTNKTNWFPGTQAFGKTSSTQTIYQNMKNNAGEVQSIATKLTDTGEDSLFARAKESGDTSEITKQIRELVTKYNNMVQNLNSGGSRIDNSYLNQLNSYVAMHRSALQATGVTKRADGTLSVDEKALKGASIDQLEKAWGSSTSFAAKAETVSVNVQANAVSSLNSLISNSYSSLLKSFGSRGNFFNFWM